MTTFYREISNEEIFCEETKKELLEWAVKDVRERAGDDTALKCEVALDEALNNALYHGNLGLTNAIIREEAEKRVKDPNYQRKKIVLFYSGIEICGSFTVIDDGKGFDHHKMVFQEITSQIEHNGGRGLTMIYKVMDEVFLNDKGNEITMMKYFK